MSVSFGLVGLLAVAIGGHLVCLVHNHQVLVGFGIAR